MVIILSLKVSTILASVVSLESACLYLATQASTKKLWTKNQRFYILISEHRQHELGQLSQLILFH